MIVILAKLPEIKLDLPVERHGLPLLKLFRTQLLLVCGGRFEARCDEIECVQLTQANLSHWGQRDASKLLPVRVLWRFVLLQLFIQLSFLDHFIELPVIVVGERLHYLVLLESKKEGVSLLADLELTFLPTRRILRVSAGHREVTLQAAPRRCKFTGRLDLVLR